MTDDELMDSILMQIECIYILEGLYHELKNQNHLAEKIMDRIYERSGAGWRLDNREPIPFVQIKTTLPMITMPISLLYRLDDKELHNLNFELKECYNLSCSPANNKPQSASWLLRVMRNALAHLPDFAAGECEPNVDFDEGHVRLRSNGLGEIVFRDENGFMNFFKDVMTACRAYVRSRTLAQMH